jgi:tetratricopeptide (TPR) repeat protein
VPATPHRILPILAAALVVALSGCQQSKQVVTPPGALPHREPDDKQPQINVATYFAHGHLLERQGNYELAAAQYRRALEARPNFVAARNRLGITLNKLARHAEATREFEKVVAMRPESASLRNNLGFSQYLEGRYAEAEATLADAIALKPDYERARMNRALALAKLNRFDEALDEFQKVGTPADAYFNIGLLLTEANRYADAAQYLQAALEARPDFEAAREQLHHVARLAAGRTSPTPSASDVRIAAVTDAPAMLSAVEDPKPTVTAQTTIAPPVQAAGSASPATPARAARPAEPSRAELADKTAESDPNCVDFDTLTRFEELESLLAHPPQATASPAPAGGTTRATPTPKVTKTPTPTPAQPANTGAAPAVPPTNSATALPQRATPPPVPAPQKPAQPTPAPAPAPTKSNGGSTADLTSQVRPVGDNAGQKPAPSESTKQGASPPAGASNGKP